VIPAVPGRFNSQRDMCRSSDHSFINASICAASLTLPSRASMPDHSSRTCRIWRAAL
jgi:hypothetical protein